MIVPAGAWRAAVHILGSHPELLHTAEQRTDITASAMSEAYTEDTLVVITEPPTVPPTTEPPATEPPVTEPPVQSEEVTATEIIPEERNERNKSIWFWHGSRDNRIKLEIGSSVRPEPYGKKTLKTYIQEYLESHGFDDVVKEYGLIEIRVNVLNIERTFLDKIMSVKRHSICGSIQVKARHIYDVTRLFRMPEIRAFLSDKTELKRLIELTKQTDSVYLQKRNVPKNYDPTGPFDFAAWQSDFLAAKDAYEHLHEELLYTDEKQPFEDAIKTFEQIDDILQEIGE